MSSSSANQLAFDLTDASETVSAPVVDTPLSPIRYPQRPADAITAAASKIAGRINAANISEAEHRGLLRERQRLLDKKFAGDLSPKEFNRLEYVRWSLDRIDDARSGLELELIEDVVSRYEILLADLRSLKLQLDARLPRKR